MSKASNRIGLIIGLLGVSLLTGCGGTSTSLPSTLHPGGGGFLSIITTQFPDAISGRSYYLILSTTGGSGALSSCAVVSGALPSGLTFSVNPAAANQCILQGSAVGAAGGYPVVVQATDTSAPPKTDQLPYTLVVRNEYSVTTTSLADGVQGRTYGIAPLSQLINTNLVGTSTPSVGQNNEFGNGPFQVGATCTIAPSNPGLALTLSAAQSDCTLASTAPLTPAGAYSVTITVTDNSITVPTQTLPVVPAKTISKTLSLTVNNPISFSANLDDYSFTPTGAGTAAEVPDAVQGRTYGAGGSSGKTSLIFTANGGLLNTAGLGFSQGASYSLPAPVVCGPFLPAAPAASSYQVTTAALTCNSGGANVTGAAGAYAFALTVSDPGNTATPPGSISSDTQGHPSHTLTVDAPLGFSLAQAGNSTPTNPAALLDAVSGRTYGVIGGTPTYTPTGGLGANESNVGAVGNSYYQWCISAGTLPATFSTTGNDLNTACSALVESPSETLQAVSAITGAAGAYPFTVQLNDTGNATTPSLAASLTNSTSLTVHTPLVATLTQNTNPTPATALLPGVIDRSYGVINADAGAPTYTATGGLMVGNKPTYLWCISAGSPPLNLVGISTACGLATSTASNSVQLTASAANPIGATGSFSFTVQANDGGNAAVPSTFAVPAGDSMVSTTVTIHPQIALSLPNFSPPPDAVLGRTYGAPNRTDLIYTVPANQGLAPLTITGTGFPAPIVCPTTVGTQQLNCNSANAAITGATSAGTVTAVDTANAAVPAATTVTDPQSQRTADTIHVDPVMALAPPALVPTAVTGRPYGTTGTCSPNPTCAPVTYTISGGLGLYQGPGTLTSTAGTFACSFTTTTYSCGSPDIALAGPSDPTLTMTASENANQTTPSGTATNSSQNLPIVAEVTIILPPTIPTAVLGRSYGLASATCSGGPCQPLVYTIPPATPGLGGPYTFTPDVGTLGGFPSNFTCPTSANVGNCQASVVGGSAGTLSNLTVTVGDAANQSTPSNAVTSSASVLAVNAELAFSAQPSTDPPAVLARRYGTGAGCSGGGCLPLTYTLQTNSGLPPYSYTFTPNNFPAGFACPTTTNSGNCQAAAVGAAGSFANLSVTAKDTPNLSVPSNSVTSSSTNMTVYQELTITSPSSVPTAVVARSYGLGSATCSGGPCVPLVYTVPTATPGLGGYTFTPNNFPTGFSCPTATNVGDCQAAAVGGSPGTFATPTVTVGDTPNASSPNNTVTSSAISLTVDPELNFTVTPPSPLAAAVNTRTYGVGTTCGAAGNVACTSLNYTIQTGSGLTGYSYTFTLNSGNGGFACAAAGTSTSCSSGDVTGAAGTYNSVHASVTDIANASTPANTIASPNGSMTVDSELVLTPPASAPLAVQGRTYGQGTTCGAAGTATCATLNYTIANGLGLYVTPATMTTTAGTFACPLVTSTYQCSSADITGLGSANLSLNIVETGNGSTPGKSVTNATVNLTIDPEMNFTAAPTSPAPAVAGRTYGLGSACGALGTSACTPLTYTIQTGSGLGGYSYAFSPSLDFSCPGSAATTICTSPSVGAVGTYATVHASVTDTGDASTPGKTIASSNSTLTVDPEMTVTPPATAPPAVIGRRYGTGVGCSGGNCTPLTYTVPAGTAGLGGPYVFAPHNFPSGFACPTTANTGNCQDSSVGGSAGTFTNLTVTAMDTANASTPSGSVPSLPATTLVVDAEMTVTAPIPPTAVHGRAYGTGTGCSPTSLCAPLAYSLTNGLGNYTATGSSLTDGVDTFTLALASPTFSFSDTAITGLGGTAPTLTFTGAETGNASTPGNSVTDATKTLVTHSELTVTAPTPATAVHGRAYGTGTGCSPTSLCAPLAYILANGLGNYTATGSSLTDGVDAFTLAFVSPTFSFSDTAITGLGGTTPTLTFTGAETGNASTPGNHIIDTSKTLTTNAEMTVTPPVSVPAAVHNRPYGTGTGCLPVTQCAPLAYALSNGLGNYTATGSSLADGVDTFTLAFASPTFSFSDAAITGVGGTTPTLTFTGAETGNVSTPGNSVVNATQTLDIDSQLAVTVTIGGAGYTASQAWPVGVNARSYGTGMGCTGGGACSLPIYSATGGLSPTYTFSYAGLTGMGFSCTPANPTATVACTAATLAAGTPSVTVADTANQATPAATALTDPSSTLASILTVNPEIVITNTFLENATVGEPYSATLDSNRGGLGAPYVWCAGTISSGPTCTPSGGIAGVTFGTPALLPLDDPTATIRGYYFGTPTTSGSVSTTIQVADDGDATTPTCATAATCPTLALNTAANEPKVFNSQGFVANNFSADLFGFDTNFVNTPTNVALGTGAPNAARVTPDGQWVYVIKGTGNVSVVDPIAGAKAVSDITTAFPSLFNLYALDIEPQQYFTANPTTCATPPCSNLSPFIRYDAWLVDPSPTGGIANAAVEPIPDAENPGMVPATLVAANALNVVDAFGIAVTPDALQGWVSLNASCVPTTTCNTLVPLSLPALSATAATTYPAAAGTRMTLGLNGGPVAVDPRGNYVYTVQMDQTNTYPYIAITTTAAPDPPLSPTSLVGALPYGANPTGTLRVCQAGGSPAGITVSPDGNRLFIACQNDPNNVVEVWNVSQAIGSLIGSDTLLLAPIRTIDLPASLTPAPTTVYPLESGCTTPVDIKANMTTSTYGTRFYVTCYNSDTIIAYDYSTGSGSVVIDSFTENADISVDNPVITATSTGTYQAACLMTGSSCPEGLDLTPNPAIHFTTGGYSPTLPFSLPAASVTTAAYFQYAAVEGGPVPRTWSEPTGLLGTGSCAGLMLNAATGEITGAPTTAGTCGPFTIRVSDGTSTVSPAYAGQFVERTFTISVVP
ncbi:MAG: hypothetical protein ABSG32_14235 [Terriglobia bacterium]